MKGLNVFNPELQTPTPRAPAGGFAPHPYRTKPDLSTQRGRLEDRVLKTLASIYDPEIPVNIVELGLIYGIDIDDDNVAHVRMTLTAPNCPVAQSMPEDVRQRAASAEGVSDATIEVVWDPPWHRGMMSEAARLELNL